MLGEPRCSRIEISLSQSYLDPENKVIPRSSNLKLHKMDECSVEFKPPNIKPHPRLDTSYQLTLYNIPPLNRNSTNYKPEYGFSTTSVGEARKLSLARISRSIDSSSEAKYILNKCNSNHEKSYKLCCLTCLVRK